MNARSNSTAGQVMSAPLVSITQDTPLCDAARTLTEERIGGAVVTDSAGRPVGVASLFDIVLHLAGLDRPAGEPGGFYRFSYPTAEEDGGAWAPEWEEAEAAAPREVPVGEIMSPEITGVPEATSVEEVARLLWRKHIHRVFVLRDGLPVGILTSMDVLRILSGGPVRPLRKAESRS